MEIGGWLSQMYDGRRRSEMKGRGCDLLPVESAPFACRYRRRLRIVRLSFAGKPVQLHDGGVQRYVPEKVAEGAFAHTIQKVIDGE